MPSHSGPPYVATHEKGPDATLGQVLTTGERAYKDELNMAHMYGLQMLLYQTSSRPSTLEELQDVKARYPLNDHAKAMLGIRPRSVKLVEDNIPTDLGEEHDESKESEDKEIAEDSPFVVEGEPILLNALADDK